MSAHKFYWFDFPVFFSLAQGCSECREICICYNFLVRDILGEALSMDKVSPLFDQMRFFRSKSSAFSSSIIR